MNQTLDLRRVWLLIRGDFVADYRPLLITSATLAALMLIGSVWRVVQEFGGPGASYYLPWYFGTLFIWGAIVASSSFAELHDKTRNEAYLLLPASALEKTVARLFRATIAFFVFWVLFLTLSSLVIEGFNWFVFGRRNAFFPPSLEVVRASAGHFLVLASVYFLGAAWFRRLHFVKTALTLTAIPVAAICLVALVMKLISGSLSLQLTQGELYGFYLAHQMLLDTLLVLLQLTYFVVLPIFCWVVAWLRVKETEVSHGV